jgi:hypothetical protein
LDRRRSRGDAHLLTSFLDWLQTSALGRSEASATDNHGTWYDTGVAADGSQPAELARTNGWGHSNCNAKGFCRLAQTASHLGVDPWPASGGAMVNAFDYLLAGDEKGKSAWLHGQISPLEPSWPISLFHAAADLAGDKVAQAALPMVPAPADGDLWPLLPECVPAAIQVQ